MNVFHSIMLYELSLVLSLSSCWFECFSYILRFKKQDTKLLPTPSPNINRFSKKIFAHRLSGKFATKSYLNIPPQLKYVATLPCEI